MQHASRYEYGTIFISHDITRKAFFEGCTTMEDEKEYVDGYELHALGWLFWMNIFALQGEDGLHISDGRADLFEKEIEARARLDPMQNMYAQRRVRFGGEVVESVKKLLRLMILRCPERFGYTALLRRRRYFGFATLLNFAAAYIVAEFFPPTFLWNSNIAFAFFMIGLISCFPLTVLFRVTGMMKRLRFGEK